MADQQFRVSDTVKVVRNTWKGRRMVLDHPAWDRPNAWWVRTPSGRRERSVTYLVDECDMEPVTENVNA